MSTMNEVIETRGQEAWGWFEQATMGFLRKNGCPHWDFEELVGDAAEIFVGCYGHREIDAEQHMYKLRVLITRSVHSACRDAERRLEKKARLFDPHQIDGVSGCGVIGQRSFNLDLLEGSFSPRSAHTIGMRFTEWMQTRPDRDLELAERLRAGDTQAEIARSWGRSRTAVTARKHRIRHDFEAGISHENVHEKVTETK